MNKTLHGLVLALFAFSCWILSLILRLPQMVAPKMSHPLPAFSRFCMGAGPIVLAVLVAVALVYCCVIWLRKSHGSPSWVTFLAASMSMIVLAMLPTVIAIYLPVVDFINSLPRT
jgi:hypothetical protein